MGPKVLLVLRARRDLKGLGGQPDLKANRAQLVLRAELVHKVYVDPREDLKGLQVRAEQLAPKV